MAILKHATLAQALHAYANNTFVYNNPCSKCGKQCSTPTMEIWLRRIRKHGGVEQMYAEYACNQCRRQEPLHNIATDPVVMSKKKIKVEPEPVAAVQRRMPRPGDPVRAPKGCTGMSVWETNTDGVMEFRGTTWIKLISDELDKKLLQNEQKSANDENVETTQE